ncbi:DNA-binding protein HEXBP-like isoform X1 [Phoenix dactylifera]|uniref:DNA-binding protein HEXBP-like isoform X1 n=1 Tax=Phoenix dactylifera TaxID=42345 RepID=A0A8B8ZB01_PHODC|nr:DNA-binding protein HEXBP-like isoform X1 [Phoenix dactylifera]
MLEVEDDASFLSLVEAAEAEALGADKAKRRKVSTDGPPPLLSAEEGSYMAALRGSRSSLWQQQQQELKFQQKKNDSGGLRLGGNPSAFSPSSNGNACFNCGMAGHWARDCTAGSGREGEGPHARRVAFVGGEDGEVPEKACPCGAGSCLVLTSNTVKNPGRKFYRCPVKEENGGCNFFEWCDDPSSSIPSSRSVLNQRSSLSVPDLLCPCGAGSCLVLVTKTGANVGRQYYRCPVDEGRGSCGFFKWCNEHVSAASQPATASRYYGVKNNSGSQTNGEKSSSSCFKCGQEGHWSRECPKQSLDNYASIGRTHFVSSGSGTCFRCGKTGHWARECPAQDAGVSAGSKRTSITSRTPYTSSCK